MTEHVKSGLKARAHAAAAGAILFSILAALVVFGTAPASAAGDKASAQRFQRILIVVLENGAYDWALQQPFMNHLTKIGALLTNSHGVAYPSFPNYLAMVAGSTFGVRKNKKIKLDRRHVADLLEEHGLSWKVYVEDLPAGSCFKGKRSTDRLYVRKHQPFITFKNVYKNPDRCARIVKADRLQRDLAQGTLPSYMFYVPNNVNNGHDIPAHARHLSKSKGRKARLPHADKWLKRLLSPLLANSLFMRETLIVVTFDEDDRKHGNRIYTVLVGPMVKAGSTDNTRYDHYSLLRTIEDNYGLGTLGRNDAKAGAICCIWKNAPGKLGKAAPITR